jgi:hypothetical protein
VLEFGKDLLDRKENGTIGGQEQEICAGRPNSPLYRLTLVGAEVINDHDIAPLRAGTSICST